jgi:serine/threonine protein kinase
MTLTDAASRVRVCPVCDTQTLDARCPRDGQPTVRPDELLARAVVDPLVGQTLESKFEVQARVGSGSMGTVYRALHLRTGATIALKVLHPSLAEQPSAIRRFLVEAQNAGRLESAHCVRVIDRGETPTGLPFLAMEFVAGETLAERVERRGPLGPEQAVVVAEQIVKGLGEAHQRGLVHRDVKPENVMLVPQFGDDDLVKILDFGIARVNDTGAAGTQVLGTPRYMAPEQWEGRADPRTDLYALGCLLHFLLTGHPPFDFSDADEHQVVQRYQAAHRTQSPPALPLPARAPLAELVDDLLRKDPDLRPRDAAAVLERLRAMRGRTAIVPALNRTTPLPATPPEDPGISVPTVLLALDEGHTTESVAPTDSFTAPEQAVPVDFDEDAPTRALPSPGLDAAVLDEESATRAEAVSPAVALAAEQAAIAAQTRADAASLPAALPRLRPPGPLPAASGAAPSGLPPLPTSLTRPAAPPSVSTPWRIWALGLALALVGGVALGYLFGG